MSVVNIVSPSGGSGGGPGGSKDPELEQRISRLEHILERLEPRITEILLTGAKTADMQKVQVELAELKGRIAAVDAKLGTLPSTFDAKLAALPSTYTILTIVFTTTWALGSGILIFALNILRR
jgi:hypothetical protein